MKSVPFHFLKIKHTNGALTRQAARLPTANFQAYSFSRVRAYTRIINQTIYAEVVI